MKVITKSVIIDSEEFVLIYDEKQGRKFYGTIPYTELDSNGCMKRALNGFQMCIGDDINTALDRRTKAIAVEKFKAEEHTEEELIAFIIAQ